MIELSKGVVPIVFGFDKSFTIPAGICITSLLDNSLESTSYEIHIISRDLGRESKDKFVRMLDSYNGNHRIIFHDPGPAYGNDPTTGHFTTAMYYRFLIPRLLENYQKALYSDVDVVFLDDISHLMDIDLGDNYLAAVTARYVDHLLEKSLKKSNIYYLKDKYFASGFLVINIKKIIADRLIERLDELIRDNSYEFPDNDALNVACIDKVVYLHLRYCVPPFAESLLKLDINRFDKYRNKMLNESIQDPSIIHYLGPDKPWHGHVTTIYESYWWEYYNKSIWYNRWYFVRNGVFGKARYQLKSVRKRLKKKVKWW